MSSTAISMPSTPTHAQRQAIFRTLIEAQDAGQTVAATLKTTAEKFQVSPEMVKQIETEGVNKEWPPL